MADRFADKPGWSARFRLVEAQAAAWRGMSDTVLQTLNTAFPAVHDPDIRIERLSLTSLAHARLQEFGTAEDELRQASVLCSAQLRPACTTVEEAQASFSMEKGQLQLASEFYSRTLAMARAYNQPFYEATALANIAVTHLLEEHFDEAIDWLRKSDAVAQRIDAQDILLNNTGNLGWAYYKLGEPERALRLYDDAEKRAVALGDEDNEINWLMTRGYVFEDTHDFPAAFQSYQQALRLASESNSREKTIDSLESLAHVSVEMRNPDRTEAYIRQADPLIRAGTNHLDALALALVRGRAASLRHQDQQAVSLLRAVDADPGSQTSMRLDAEHQLATLFESEGRIPEALAMYSTALSTFESARAQLKNENSKLPFFANATPIYDDYIHLLISQGKVAEALAAADQSRARTLEQGLGLTPNDQPFRPASLRPQAIAAKMHATLLFYWLGEKQSYLWAVTPRQTEVFPLPPRTEISRMVERYRQALLGPEDPLDSANDDGFALYRTLVQPAKNLLGPEANVVVLSDGDLSKINFETLLVPGPRPHYWIEDASVVSAPSLLMLAAARPANNSGGRLLLIGDAVSPSPDYPSLPNAAQEMQQVGRHFAAQEQTVLSGPDATSAAYLGSAPRKFAYIDFVAHGVASRTDPLDSAIILSRTGEAGDSFKLYAREIIRHPIDARLVTISACYGSGTRAYAGEGLVGLSWAFLRAGAHHVIGALWEVSDDSTPRLMDSVYQGLTSGMSPSAALRQAKLNLLHSHTPFRRPFFWGPFQLYTGS